MKITKTGHKKGEDFIIVYTDTFPEIGFHVDTNEVNNKADLLAKTQIKVDEEIARRNLETARLAKYNSLKVENA